MPTMDKRRFRPMIAALILVAVAAFMYASIMFKIVNFGP